MSASELIGHIYRRRDHHPRGSAAWVDLDRAVLLIDRALSRPGRGSVVEMTEAERLVERRAPELAGDVRAVAGGGR